MTPNPSPASQAHRLYREGKFEEALRLNVNELEAARSKKSRTQERDSSLHVGLCQYWLHRFDESEHFIRVALKIAEEDRDQLQSLIIRNHLGATLRGKGDLLAAYQIFEEALEEAASPDLHVARMRLLGNFGALLDELGQREQADDCYSRYEELAQLTGDLDRLANARGLVARSAELRKDWDMAAAKFQQERHLAEQSGNKLRQLAARLHNARMVAKSSRKEEAAALLEEAVNDARRVGNSRRLAEALESQGAFLADHNLGHAFELIGEARGICQPEENYSERLANIDHQLALIAQKAGLHGESLFYLMRSVDRRYKLYELLRRDPKLRQRAQRRLDEPARLASELVDEACRVSRSTEEKQKLLELHNRLHDSQQTWEHLIQLQKQDQSSTEHPWEYVGRVRKESEQRWKTVLLPGCLEKLSPETQEDLIQAEVSYTTTVNDLPRCVHLLATAIEREVRLRLFGPVPESARPPTLGSFKKFLTDHSVNAGTAFRERFSRIGPRANALRHILTEDIVALDGSKLSLVDLRNAVAHGNERAEYPYLSRLLVDAVKRHAVLTPPSALQLLAEQPVL